MKDEPLPITINAAGEIYIRDELVAQEELASRLAVIIGAAPNTRVLLQNAPSPEWSVVLEVMRMVTAAGLTRMAVIAEPIKPSETDTEMPVPTSSPPSKQNRD